MTVTDLIPSISIEALLARRNGAVERVRSMLQTHFEIQELLEPVKHSAAGTQELRQALRKAAGGVLNA